MGNALSPEEEMPAGPRACLGDAAATAWPPWHAGHPVQPSPAPRYVALPAGTWHRGTGPFPRDTPLSTVPLPGTGNVGQRCPGRFYFRMQLLTPRVNHRCSISAATPQAVGTYGARTPRPQDARDAGDGWRGEHPQELPAPGCHLRLGTDERWPRGGLRPGGCYKGAQDL